MRPARIERKTDTQLRAMRAAGLVVGRTLERIRSQASAGHTTAELDLMAREEIASAGAVSSFLGYDGGVGLPPFPAVTCISVNSEVVHGVPGERVLADGDLVSVDFGVALNGWNGDAAVTFAIGAATPQRLRLSEVTCDALWSGIAAMRAGGRVGDISQAVENRLRREPGRYGVVEEYTGHGIGSAMHMEPDVPNLGRRGRGPKLFTGLALAIEPMVTLGSAQVVTLDDEWTVATRDGSVAAHWEHTVAITDHGLWVLTALDGGEAELAARGIAFGPLAD